MIKHIVSALVLTSLGGVALAGDVAEGRPATLAMVEPTRIEQPVAIADLRYDRHEVKITVAQAINRKVAVMTKQLDDKIAQKLESALKKPL